MAESVEDDEEDETDAYENDFEDQSDDENNFFVIHRQITMGWYQIQSKHEVFEDTG